MPEYELEHPTSYYGTYVDDIVTGSMLPSGQRGWVASECKSSTEYLWATRASEFYFKSVLPYYHAGSTKTVNLFSEKEYYFDSLVPWYKQICDTNGVYFVSSAMDRISGGPFLEDIYCFYIASDTNSTIVASDTKTISDNHWYWDYPFQYKYRNIPRVLGKSNFWVENAYIGCDSGGGAAIFQHTAVTDIHASNVVVPVFFQGTVASFVRAYALYDVPMPAFAGAISCTNEDFLKAYYGFGVQPVSAAPIVAKTNYTGIWVLGDYISGWKYGLVSGIPTPTRAVFRTGHYGQPRDMLEGRQLTSFVDPTIMKYTEGPITVTFTAGTADYVIASNPILNTRESGLYDIYCRAAIPFIDQ